MRERTVSASEELIQNPKICTSARLVEHICQTLCPRFSNREVPCKRNKKLRQESTFALSHLCMGLSMRTSTPVLGNTRIVGLEDDGFQCSWPIGSSKRHAPLVIKFQLISQLRLEKRHMRRNDNVACYHQVHDGSFTVKGMVIMRRSLQ